MVTVGGVDLKGKENFAESFVGSVNVVERL